MVVLLDYMNRRMFAGTTPFIISLSLLVVSMTDAQPYDPAKYAFHVSIGHEFSFPSPAPGEVPHAKLTVPENKRFVMEYVNITGLGPGGAETIMFCALQTVVAGTSVNYIFPLTNYVSTPQWRTERIFSQPARIYADSNQDNRFWCTQHGSTTGKWTGIASLSGYLTDMP